MQKRRHAKSLFSSVLCPVDFSNHSSAALRFAAAMARRARASLQVLYVNDPLLVAAAAAGYDESALGAASERELRRFVSSTVPAAATRQLHPTFVTALGKPAREIRRTVERSGHDLVVVGTKGLNGARRLLLGSTTSEILRRARVPVLAVPPADDRTGRSSVRASWPGGTVVAAIELGARALDDVRRAADVARWFDAALVLVHVVPLPATPSWVSSDIEALLRARCRKAERALDKARAAASGVTTSVVVRLGYPPDEIAAVAAEQKAGLIIMSLRGRSGLFGEPAGSCTYQVLCHGAAPVLALPDARKGGRG
jgi:nucleotide-binding universal stress UspA family protein